MLTQPFSAFTLNAVLDRGGVISAWGGMDGELLVRVRLLDDVLVSPASGNPYIPWVRAYRTYSCPADSQPRPSSIAQPGQDWRGMVSPRQSNCLCSQPDRSRRVRHRSRRRGSACP